MHEDIFNETERWYTVESVINYSAFQIFIHYPEFLLMVL